MTKIKIPEPEKIPIQKLKTDGDNPNQMTEAQLKALQENIKHYGFIIPIITNKNLVIADGEHRLKASKKLGMKKVPVVRLDLDTIDRKILRQVLNKLQGKHSHKKDIQEYTTIDQAQRTKELETLLGRPEEISTLLSNKEILEDQETFTEQDAENTYNQDTIIEHGDLYKLGPHRLIVGDATKPRTYTALMKKKEQANLVFTDPPYGVDYNPERAKNRYKFKKSKHEKIQNDSLQKTEFYTFLKKTWQNTKKHTTNNASWYVCSPSKTNALTIQQTLTTTGIKIRNLIIWAKNHFTLGRGHYHWKHELIWYGNEGKNPYWCGKRNQDTLWEIQIPNNTSYEHPTQKPVKIPGRAIKNSTKKNGVVLDPFAGSGSTLIAVQKTRKRRRGGDTLIASDQLQRKARLIELSPKYAQVIINRWERYRENNDLPKEYKAKKIKNIKKAS